jgi:N-acetyl-anhydromuramyl-L-alanine amidase AmpD
LEGTLNYLCDAKNSVSANYLISKTGEIYELVSPYKRAWHAGAGQGFGVPKNNMNAYSVGVEIMNKGNGKDPYPEEQMQALETLLTYLNEVYRSVPRIDHKMWAPGRKVDLSSNFPFERFGLPLPSAAEKSLSVFSKNALPTQNGEPVEPDLIDRTGRYGETGFESWVAP